MSKAGNTAKVTPIVQHLAADNFLRQVRLTIERHRMLLPGERVVVGLSGGPDSVALLGALNLLSGPLGIAVTAAHLNHGLRGDEALRDQVFSEQLARRLGVECEVGAVSLAAGGNLEARARHARYAFLSDATRRVGARKIATAHTMDDQAETVVMRLMRGAGWEGLSGIAPVRDGWIIRPLIDCSRKDVMAFLAARNLPFCSDRTNDDRRFVRNRIRHDVMPLLTTFNGQLGNAIANTAALMAAGARVLNRNVRAALSTTVQTDGSLSVQILRGHGPELGLLIVREWLRELRGSSVNLGAGHYEGALSLAFGDRPNGSFALPSGAMVLREYDALRFMPEACAMRGAPVFDRPAAVLPNQGSLWFDNRWRFDATQVDPPSLSFRPGDCWSLYVDRKALPGEILVRTCRPGDRVRPFGMNGRQRKLQDVFVDSKVPRLQRRGYPVLVLEEEILWVPGIVRGSAAPVLPTTQAVLRVTAGRPAVQESGIAGGNHVC
ncbi:MAG: tRNA lysidine(34) synthetase TilS [Deltaproteobacteria bacterium]|nr:tRNA lysidine(34) synthetase TilS [Deltaproteobacteria bacterium]